MRGAWLLSLLLTPHASCTTLREQLNATLHEHDGVGLAAYTVKQYGEVCSFTAVGERIRGTAEHGGAMTADMRSRYHHGSVTKSMTTTLMAILMHDGTLDASWNSTLTAVLPSLASGTAYANVTLVLCTLQFKWRLIAGHQLAPVG